MQPDDWDADQAALAAGQPAGTRRSRGTSRNNCRFSALPSGTDESDVRKPAAGRLDAERESDLNENPTGDKDPADTSEGDLQI